MADIRHFPTPDERNAAELRALFAQELLKRGIGGAVATEAAKRLTDEFGAYVDFLVARQPSRDVPVQSRTPFTEDQINGVREALVAYREAFGDAARVAWLQARIEAEVRVLLGERRAK